MLLFVFILFYLFIFFCLFEENTHVGACSSHQPGIVGCLVQSTELLAFAISVCSLLFEVRRGRITRVFTSSALSSGSKEGALESLSEIQYKMILDLGFLRKLVWVEHQREGHEPKAL